MNKKTPLAVLLLVAALLALAACQNATAAGTPTGVVAVDWTMLSAPPELQAGEGENCLTAGLGNYNWSYYTDSSQGQCTSVIACGMHPLDWSPVPELTLPESASDLPLVWQVEPGEVNVEVYDYDFWYNRTCGNTTYDEALVQEARPLAQFQSLPLLPGQRYLYVINASWGEAEQQVGGDCVYAFIVNQPEPEYLFVDNPAA